MTTSHLRAHLRVAVAVGLALSLSVPTRPARADQSGAGVIIGTVVDITSHKPVEGASVSVTSSAQQGLQVVVTDKAGFYRLPTVTSGLYNVYIEKDLYQPYMLEGVSVRAAATIRVNAAIAPLAFDAGSITVYEKIPTVDVGSSANSTNITDELTRRVPLAPPSVKGAASRSFESVAEVAPGARADTYGLSVAGASSLENGYQVDGVSVSNPGFGMIGTGLSTEFLKEVNVISGGYLPEYGRTTGGVLNAITKSGSNEFHGSVFSFYTPGSLQAGAKKVNSAVGSVSSSNPLNYMGDVGLELGGPIIKDKLWFYAGGDVSGTAYHADRTFYRQIADASTPGGFRLGADGNPAREPVPGGSESYDAVSRQIQGIVKLTYSPTPDNHIALSAFTAPTHSGGPGKFAIDPLQDVPETVVNTTTPFNGTYNSIAHQLNNRPYDVSLKWITDLASKRLQVDTTAAWHHQEVDVLAADGSQPGSGSGLAAVPSVSWTRSGPYHPITDFESSPALMTGCGPGGMLCPVTSYTSGGPATNTGALELQNFNRYSLGSTVSYLLAGWGHHVIKAGITLEYATFDHVAAHSGGEALLERSDGSRFDVLEGYGILLSPDNPVRLEPRHISSAAITEGGFVQDSWSVLDKVTVNFGARYDSQQLFANGGKLGLSLPNQWSPRLGVVFDPTQQGRSKFFANYARYYQNLGVHLADASLSGTPNIVSTHPGIDSGVCDVRVAPYCQTDAGRVVGDANRGSAASTPWSASQRWGAIGGTAKSIDPDLKPTSSDELVFGGEYEILPDARLGVAYTRRWLNYFIEDMSNDGLQTYFLSNPGYGMANDFPKAVRNYDALSLYFVKAFTHGWLATASYTYSSLRGNISGLFRAQNGELDPNHNADFDSKIYTINADGPLPGDHAHDLKIFAAKDWVLAAAHRLSTGVALRGRSGEPTNYWASDSQYGPQINLLLPRGAGPRLPWNGSLDLNLGYRLQLPGAKTVYLSVDVFNLLNFQTKTAVDESYTLAAAQGKQNGTLADAFTQGSPRRALTDADVNRNFGTATKYQPPRTFRFGLRAAF